MATQHTDGGAEPVSHTCQRPVRRPVMLQGWHDLTAVHWRYDPEVVQALLPHGFRIDSFDGSAWVGLIAFHMHRIRVPGLPAFGRFSTFPETNVRTYIVDPTGQRGVWFCSLDVTRLVPTLIARATYRLPYCWADMAIDRQGDVVRYTSRRRWPKGSAASDVQARVGELLTPENTTDLDHFLSARWGLGSTLGRRLMWADVDHPQWPLHRAELLSCEETLVTAAGLPAPTGPATAVWSPGVEVRIGRPRLVHRDRPIS